MKAELLRRYARHSLADTVRGFDGYFARDLFSLTHLFIEERRRVLTLVIQAVLEKHEQTYHTIWEETRKLMRYLREAEAPIPDVFRITARHVLEGEITTALADVADTGVIPETVFELGAEARALGLSLDLSPARERVGLAITRALEAIGAKPAPDRVGAALALVAGANELGVRFGLWRTQNVFFDLWRSHRDVRPQLLALARALGFDLKPEVP
jgi:hypothetical protein